MLIYLFMLNIIKIIDLPLYVININVLIFFIIIDIAIEILIIIILIIIFHFSNLQQYSYNNKIFFEKYKIKI